MAIYSRKIWVLSEKAVKSFQECVELECREKISDEEATNKALNFLTAFNLVFMPLKKKWVEEDLKKEIKNGDKGNTTKK